MSSKTYQILGAILACFMVAYYFYHATKGTEPLENPSAERLLRVRDYVQAIAPDGELAQESISILDKFRAIDCPKLDSSTGSLPGRYGMGSRTYGGATFECLFTGESPSGTVLYFSAFVHRTADPSVRRSTDGLSLSLLKSDRTRALMRDLGRQTRAYGKDEQAALWASLAADDIYVPADRTQTSPLQKAMEKHIKRISSP